MQKQSGTRSVVHTVYANPASAQAWRLPAPCRPFERWQFVKVIRTNVKWRVHVLWERGEQSWTTRGGELTQKPLHALFTHIKSVNATETEDWTEMKSKPYGLLIRNFQKYHITDRQGTIKCWLSWPSWDAFFMKSDKNMGNGMLMVSLQCSCEEFSWYVGDQLGWNL